MEYFPVYTNLGYSYKKEGLSMLIWITLVAVLLGFAILYDGYAKRKQSQLNMEQYEDVNAAHINDAYAEANVHNMREQNQTNGLL